MAEGSVGSWPNASSRKHAPSVINECGLILSRNRWEVRSCSIVRLGLERSRLTTRIPFSARCLWNWCCDDCLALPFEQFPSRWQHCRSQGDLNYFAGNEFQYGELKCHQRRSPCQERKPEQAAQNN